MLQRVDSLRWVHCFRRPWSSCLIASLEPRECSGRIKTSKLVFRSWKILVRESLRIHRHMRPRVQGPPAKDSQIIGHRISNVYTWTQPIEGNVVLGQCYCLSKEWHLAANTKRRRCCPAKSVRVWTVTALQMITTRTRSSKWLDRNVTMSTWA